MANNARMYVCRSDLETHKDLYPLLCLKMRPFTEGGVTLEFKKKTEGMVRKLWDEEGMDFSIISENKYLDNPLLKTAVRLVMRCHVTNVDYFATKLRLFMQRNMSECFGDDKTCDYMVYTIPNMERKLVSFDLRFNASHHLGRKDNSYGKFVDDFLGISRWCLPKYDLAFSHYDPKGVVYCIKVTGPSERTHFDPMLRTDVPRDFTKSLTTSPHFKEFFANSGFYWSVYRTSD